MEVQVGGAHWNNDPEWTRYVARFEGVIAAIAAKKTTDVGIRQDCEQEARIALLSVYPETIRGYERYVAGTITDREWNQNLDRYCRNVIRNSILSYLESPKTGNWRIGRTKRVLNKTTGKRVKHYEVPRHSSFDDLVDNAGLQIDEEFNATWRISLEKYMTMIPSLYDDSNEER